MRSRILISVRTALYMHMHYLIADLCTYRRGIVKQTLLDTAYKVSHNNAPQQPPPRKSEMTV